MSGLKKIKWGVIGSGGIAQRRTIPEGLMPASNAELVAVYDINEQVNRQVAEKYGAVASKSIEELLSSEIDAIYNASPVNVHLEHVLACAAAKKHVLCEKPLGMTVDEAEQMVAVCRAEGVTLGTGLMMRFHSQHQSALKIIREGGIGKPVFGRAQLSCWYPPIEGAWRQNPELGGGGSLMDMGSHCIDLLEMFFGPLKRVNCFVGSSVHSYKSEDTAIVSMVFKNGAMATVDACFCIPDNSSKNVLELYGSTGSILAKGTIGQGESGEMTAYLETEITGYDANQQRNSGDGISIIPEPVNMYRAEIEEFSAALIEGREPLNNWKIGLQSQKVMEACYNSAKSGQITYV